MRKKILRSGAILLISALLFGLFTGIVTAEEHTFSDIEGHKNQTAIQFLKDLEIVHGHPDGTFKPDDGVNRAEALKMLFEARGGTGLEEPTEQCFPDVPLEEWYAIYVCSGEKLGYVHGYPDGDFRPADQINKVEFIKLLAMFAEWDLTETEEEELFDDTSDEEWYAPFLKYAKMKNLIEYSGNKYHPSDDMIRGEVAESIFRYALIKYLGTERYEASDVETYLNDYYGGGDQTSSDDTTDTTDTADTTDTTDTTTDTSITTVPTSCTEASDALSIVQTNFVDGNDYEDYLGVWQYSEMLGEDDNIAYFDENNEGAGFFLEAGEEKWFHWIDYTPTEMFFHDTKIVTVNADCSYEEYDSVSWPYINGDKYWDTVEDKLESPELKIAGDDLDAQIAELIAELSRDNPQFGTCGADPNENKRAIVVWLGTDTFIKRNAVNWYTHLCNNNYITSVITGTDGATVLSAIETELRALETESHDSGLTNVHFHVSSHGMRPTGDLFVNDTITINMDVDPPTITLGTDSIDLDDLAAKFGEIAFTVGADTGIWSDSFTIIHDTCFSGNAVPKYQAQAYVEGTRESAVGYIGAAAQADEVGVATPILQRGHFFTNALTTCTTDMGTHANLLACINAEMDKLYLLEKPDWAPHPMIEKLSPLTDDYVPFMP